MNYINKNLYSDSLLYGWPFGYGVDSKNQILKNKEPFRAYLINNNYNKNKLENVTSMRLRLIRMVDKLL